MSASHFQFVQKLIPLTSFGVDHPTCIFIKLCFKISEMMPQRIKAQFFYVSRFYTLYPKSVYKTKTKFSVYSLYCYYLVGCVTYKTGFRLVNRFIDHLHVETTNSFYTISDLHTTNQSTLSLYLVTALHKDHSSAVFSLNVSWYRILAMEILQLPLLAG
jgi:hypothetical protein